MLGQKSGKGGAKCGTISSDDNLWPAIVDYSSDIQLVNPHTKSNCRNNNLQKKNYTYVGSYASMQIATISCITVYINRFEIQITENKIALACNTNSDRQLLNQNQLEHKLKTTTRV